MCDDTTFTLDCSSAENALDSLCDAFSCSTDELENFLLSIDLDSIYDDYESAPNIWNYEYLYQQCVEQFGNPKEIEKVYFFHCTRTDPNENFQDGILPLGDILDSLWEMLIRLSPNDIVAQRLEELQTNGPRNHLYGLKVNDSMHWGPYAILVKDVAFYAEELHQHDYLKIPEIIEDICNAYFDIYSENILEHYEDVLTPKIVTFSLNSQNDNGYIQAALGYTYRSVREEPPCGMSVICIDCEGMVSSEHIFNVEGV